MTAGLAGFVPLLGLVSPWAKQGSVPSAMVLRRICDWGLTDVFPVGAFVTKTGDEVDPFDLYVSCRALEASGTAIPWISVRRSALFVGVNVSKMSTCPSRICWHSASARTLFRRFRCSDNGKDGFGKFFAAAGTSPRHCVATLMR